MAMTLPTYPEFDVKADGLSRRWKKWHACLDQVFIGYDITDAARRKALLLTFAGSDFCDLVDTFQEAKFTITDHFNPKTNLELQRFIFHETFQKNQFILEYYAEMDSIAATCNFHNKQQEIKSQIIRGC